MQTKLRNLFILVFLSCLTMISCSKKEKDTCNNKGMLTIGCTGPGATGTYQVKVSGQNTLTMTPGDERLFQLDTGWHVITITGNPNDKDSIHLYPCEEIYYVFPGP